MPRIFSIIVGNIAVAGIGLAAMIATTMPAQAQGSGRPMLVPHHDATVTYHLEAGPDAPNTAQVFYQAGGSHVRIEPAGQPGHILIDRAAGKAMMVMQNSNFGIETDIGRQIDQALNDPNAHFNPGGGGTVAGLPCHNWTMTSPNASGSGCVSDDGLILSAQGHDRKGHSMLIRATAVSEAPLPATLFAAPSQSLRLDSLAKFGRMLRDQ